MRAILSPAKSVCVSSNLSAVTSAFLACEMRARTAPGGRTWSEICSSSMASFTRASWSAESAIENRGGSFAAAA